MAPLPSPGQVIRCGFKISDGASIDAGSRFYLAYGPSGTFPNATDLDTLAAKIAAEWLTNMAGVTFSGENLVKVECNDLSSSTGSIGTWEGTNGGTEGSNQLTAGVCAVINHQINRKYRGGRPRSYVRCGASEHLSGTNEWSTAGQTAITDGWEAWIAGILALTGISIALSNIVNVSWFEGFTVFTTPSGRARNISTLRAHPLLDNITSSSTAVKLGSQRRRLNV